MKKIFKLILVAPIAIVWDVLYRLVKTLYDVMTYIDREGEKRLESFLQD